MGILRDLRFEFQKFRILEILNFHPASSNSLTLSMLAVTFVIGKQFGPRLGLTDLDPNGLTLLIVLLKELFEKKKQTTTKA